MLTVSDKPKVCLRNTLLPLSCIPHRQTKLGKRYIQHLLRSSLSSQFHFCWMLTVTDKAGLFNKMIHCPSQAFPIDRQNWRLNILLLFPSNLINFVKIVVFCLMLTVSDKPRIYLQKALLPLSCIPHRQTKLGKRYIQHLIRFSLSSQLHFCWMLTVSGKA